MSMWPFPSIVFLQYQGCKQRAHKDPFQKPALLFPVDRYLEEQYSGN